MSETRVLPPFPPQPQPQPSYDEPRKPRRGRFAAAVVAGSLVVGGAAGVGGAAAVGALEDDPTVSLPTERQTAQVVDTGDAPAADGSVESVATTVLPSVVKIDVLTDQGGGSGSGIILSSDGQILTNNHVVEGAGEDGAITVSFADGTHADATVLGTDPLTDTAVIQAEDVCGLTPATMGKSGNVDVGQQVVAIGSPFGLDATVTSGIVSALDRPVNVGTDAEGNATVYPAIQTDAAINPGNSGGPLVDMDGTSSASTPRSAPPARRRSRPARSASASRSRSTRSCAIVDQLAAGETPTHARLGIGVDERDAQRPPTSQITDGAPVGEISDGSAAEDAGLESGDVITRVDDRGHQRRLPDRDHPLLPPRRRGHRDLPARRRGAGDHRHPGVRRLTRPRATVPA